ncbi:MAG: PAS domain-containing protein [Cryobacterium sp.]|nr:PAS domain-containing protein [Oligoflexia bacterium]
MREKLQETSSLLQVHPLFFANVSLDGEIQNVSSTSMIMLGCEFDRAIGNLVWDIKNFSKFSETRKWLMNAVKLAASGHASREKVLVEPALNSDESSHLVSLHVHPIRKRKLGITKISITAIDLSDSHGLSDSSKMEQERLARVIDVAQLGYYEWDLKTNAAVLSDQLKNKWTLEKTLDVSALFLKIHPDDRSAVISRMESAIRQHRSYHSEFRVILSDEKESWIEAAGVAFYSERGEPLCFFGTTLDITDRKLREMRIEKNEESLKKALGVSRVGFFDWDLHRDQTEFSERMRLDWDLPEQATMSQALERIHPEDLVRVRECVRYALEHHVCYSMEYRVYHRDGKEIWIEAQGEAQYDSFGNALRMLGTSVDVTERKCLELGKQAIINDLTETKSKLEQSEKKFSLERILRERFVVSLSHDLRTPLTAARYGVSMLTSGKESPERREKALRIIRENILRADRMIEDLLDANRIKAGEKIPMLLEPCHLNKVVAEVLAVLNFIHGNRFSLKCLDEIHGQVSCEGFRRILENLCNNAVKYGGKERPILIELSKSNEEIILCVHNEGNPIPVSDQSTLFDAFRRLPGIDQQEQKGWGIGLTITKGFAEAMNGTVKMTSSPETGTDFTVHLPLVEVT